MPDFDAFKREQVIHLAALKQERGWKDYVDAECKRLERLFPYQFGDMSELVRKELEKKDAK